MRTTPLSVEWGGLIHWPCFAGKAGFEQGPWHKGDEFSDRSLILNRAQRALWI